MNLTFFPTMSLTSGILFGKLFHDPGVSAEPLIFLKKVTRFESLGELFSALGFFKGTSFSIWHNSGSVRPLDVPSQKFVHPFFHLIKIVKIKKRLGKGTESASFGGFSRTTQNLLIFFMRLNGHYL